MSISLAGWLTDNRETLLPRWIAQIEDAHAPTNGNGYAAGHLNGDDDPPVELIAHPDEHRVLLASIYEGLISAAHGDRAQLDECLRLLRAFRSRPGEDELPEQLALPFTLRRVAWEALFRNGRGGAKNGLAAEQRRLMDELEELLEYTTVSMAAQWTTSAKVVARELDETLVLDDALDANHARFEILHAQRDGILGGRQRAACARENRDRQSQMLRFHVALPLKPRALQKRRGISDRRARRAD